MNVGKMVIMTDRLSKPVITVFNKTAIIIQQLYMITCIKIIQIEIYCVGQTAISRNLSSTTCYVRTTYLAILWFSIVECGN